MCLGVPGRVVETYHEHGLLMGKIDFGGVRKAACLEHVPGVAPGLTWVSYPPRLMLTFAVPQASM